MKFRIAAVLTASLAVATAEAGAQTLREQFSNLYRFGDCGQILCLAVGSGHGEHFVPASNAGNATVLAFISNAVGTGASSVPFGATTSGVTYTFSRGIPVQTATSAGPIFGERAQTLGKGRLLFGAAVSLLQFKELRGAKLSDLGFAFTHVDVAPPGMGNPAFENDLIVVNTDLQLDMRVATLVGTYGVTDRVDIGIALPLIATSMSGRSRASVQSALSLTPHFFGGTPSSPITSAVTQAEGSSTGLGDVSLRLKANLGGASSGNLAVLGEARLGTGSVENFQGTGSSSFRVAGVASRSMGNFTPHVNAGFAYRSSDVETSAVLVTAGFDHLLAPRATLAVDFISEWQAGDNKLVIPDPVTISGRSIALTNLEDKRADLVNASIGLKFSTQRGLTGIVNAIVPIMSGSLKPTAILSLGVEYSY